MADVTYQSPYPDGWHDYPDQSTPIDHEALQALDDGIKAATDQANAALTAANNAGGGSGSSSSSGYDGQTEY